MVGITPAIASDAFLVNLLGRAPGPSKTFACFTRNYRDAHLASHPGQNVRSAMVLAVAYANLPGSYQLRMGFQFKGRPEWLTTVAECNAHKAGGSARLGAPCAGPIGGGPMRVAVETGKTVTMTIPSGAHLWKPGPPAPNDTVDDAFGPDDKDFRLDRVALPLCADQAVDDAERVMLQKGR